MAAFQKQANSRHEVVVITDASAGIGRAVARRFAQAGAWLGLMARDQERLEDVQREVDTLGGKAVIFAGDVADPNTHERIAELTEQRFGAIDIWINNAAATAHGPIWELPPEEFQRVTGVAYLGVVYGTQAALRRMRPRNEGVVVQLGSALTYRSASFETAACAAKHAVRGFTDSLRAELKDDHRNVRLTTVHLPPPDTRQPGWSRGRVSSPVELTDSPDQPEIAAEAVYWAAHHRRRDVFVGRPSVIGLRLKRLLPGLADRVLPRRSFQPHSQPRVSAPSDHLWRPTRGRFGGNVTIDGGSQSRSLQLSVSQHRAAWLWAFVGMASAMAFAWRRKAGRRAPAWGRR